MEPMESTPSKVEPVKGRRIGEPKAERAIRENKLPHDDWRIASAQSLLGCSLANQKKFDEAEPLLIHGYEGIVESKKAPPERLAEANDRLIKLYEAWDKPEQAAQWRAKKSSPAK
jgi:hypothetical protein